MLRSAHAGLPVSLAVLYMQYFTVSRLLLIPLPAGAQVHKPRMHTTNIGGFLDQEQCTVSGGLRTCAIKEGVRPTLLSSNVSLGMYAWNRKVFPYIP